MRTTEDVHTAWVEAFDEWIALYSASEDPQHDEAVEAAGARQLALFLRLEELREHARG